MPVIHWNTFPPPQPVLYWWSDETIGMQNQQTFLGVMCLLPGAKQGFELLFAVSPFRLVVIGGTNVDHVAALGNAVGPDTFVSFPQTLNEFSLVGDTYI
jgi:ABC-type hemin transport system substrate-binding protein